MIGRIVQCFGVERIPAASRFATGADLESAREQELAEEAALLRAENARLVSELVEAQRALEHARLKAQLAALRTPAPATAAAASIERSRNGDPLHVDASLLVDGEGGA